MGTSLRIPRFSPGVAVGLVLACGLCNAVPADAPPGASADTAPSAAGSDTQPAVKPGSFFSSVAQAFKQDFEHEVIRGHFDVGSPPDVHRYYCLVDAKTGKREANGVGGQPALRPDGMTGIKGGAVSLYSCATAEQQGILVTTGYVLSARASGMGAFTSPAKAGVAPAPNALSPDKVDVAGVKLGMSPEQVRALLRSKKLLEYYESAGTLTEGEATRGAVSSMGSGRFVNVIAAWTRSPPAAAGEAASTDAESYEVMFTPVPGKERAMAIIHSVAYSAATAVRETTIDSGLVTKYGGFSEANDLPDAPTWRIQSGGNVLVGDACNRRGLFGGLREFKLEGATPANFALKTTPDEFRFQIEHCGTAIVTEDHAAVNGDAPRKDRMIVRFTVAAYSPVIGFDGAANAAQLMQTVEEPNKPNATRVKDQPAPNL